MSAKLKNRVLLVCCICVLSAGVPGAAVDQQSATVLTRLHTIEDPELGELIRMAMENLPEPKRLVKVSPTNKEYAELKKASDTATQKTIRLVTETYAQIKLLDTQIAQTERRISSGRTPESLQLELALVKAELQSSLTTKLAELREFMNIIPRHALGTKPVEHLRSWVKLDVLGDLAYIFECSKPFSLYARSMDHVPVKLASKKDAISFVQDILGKKDRLPLRVDILRHRDGIKVSEELRKEIIALVKKANLELEAEVHLNEYIRARHLKNSLALVKGKVGTRYRFSRIGNARMTALEIVDPMDRDTLDAWLNDLLTDRPERLPMTIDVKYDEESKDLASEVIKQIEDAARKAGVEKFVEIVQKQCASDDRSAWDN